MLVIYGMTDINQGDTLTYRRKHDSGIKKKKKEDTVWFGRKWEKIELIFEISMFDWNVISSYKPEI